MKLMWLLPKRLAIAIKEYELRRIHAKLEYYMAMVHTLYNIEHEVVEDIDDIRRK